MSRTKKRSHSKRAISSQLALILIALVLSTSANATEEQRLGEIAKRLRPISDSQWNEIAGNKTGDAYDVQKGDTLWDVSKRLFGNPNYWPKVWAINSGITNPHVIDPGRKLVFMSGSSESLPKIAMASNSGDNSSTAPLLPVSGPHTFEYDKVSQSLWAPIDAEKLQKTKNYDNYGIDKDLKVQLPNRFSFRVPAIANDTTIPYLGEITSSREERSILSQGDMIFLKSNGQDLQVGTTYTILSDSTFIRLPKKSDRTGYIYHATGEVRIIGVKDELYVGMITNAYDAIHRGDRVYPLLPVINEIKPIAAREDLEALIISNADNVEKASQYRFVHLDRGIEDGVQVGNVFRFFDYYDPKTKDKVTDSDFLIRADVLVIHATAEFSTGLIIRSRDTLQVGNFGVIMTDISDLEKQSVDRSHTVGEKQDNTDRELDELDELDRTSGEGLGDKERKEILELQHHDALPKDEPSLQSPKEGVDPELDELQTPPSTENKLVTPPTTEPTITSPKTSDLAPMSPELAPPAGNVAPVPSVPAVPAVPSVPATPPAPSTAPLEPTLDLPPSVPEVPPSTELPEMPSQTMDSVPNIEPAPSLDTPPQLH